MINIYLDFCRDTCLLVPYYDLDSFRAHLLVGHLLQLGRAFEMGFIW